MKIIHMVKPLKYDPCLNNSLDRFAGFREVGLQKYDPSIELFKANKSKSQEIAFSSPSMRAIQTAHSNGFQDPIITDFLREVKFDLAKLLSQQEFEEFGSALVRERFLKAFIEDTLIEKRSEIERRVNLLLNMLMCHKEQKITCFSHSFFIKIIEAYVLSDKKLFKNPSILSDYIKIDFPTYLYGKGPTLKI